MPETRKPTVLVVDRSAANRSQICECLAQLQGIHPIGVSSGAEARHHFQLHGPALVLLDIALHDADGISLAEELRAMDRSRNGGEFSRWTPIVFLSAIQDEDVLARGILAGGDDFLYKPVSEVVLLAKVRAMLRISSLQDELHDAHRKLREISLLDGLTNIPNRRHFDEALSTEWKRCIRHQSPISVILGDVDFFKQFNDIYGHQAGDTCLRAVAGALNESLFRVEDSVARYGGEEFAAILPGTDAIGAVAVAERMRLSARELGIPHEKGVGGLVSCSFGVASCIPDAEQQLGQLLQAADAGLYGAKRSGRNRIGLPAG
jgi:diguanylate cyclase (GGDEF)-like protein